MTDYSDFLAEEMGAAKRANAAALDDDPEQAARAIDLSDATGVPSTTIYGDVDGFERTHKATLGSQIINDNEHIVDYINSHPLAARVSHDDLGQLDNVSQSLEGIGQKSRLQKWLESDSMSESFMRGYGDAPLGSSILSRPSDVEFAMSHPEIGALAMTLASPPEFLSRAAGGLISLGHDGVAQVLGEGPANELAAMAEWAMMRGDIGVHAEGGPLKRVEQNAKALEHIRNVANGLQLADPWTQIGREPPLGLHPLIDKAKEIQAREDIRALDGAMSEASKSATRERSPDLFADNFLRGPLADRTIRINAEAIRELYGDKQPTPDDGILGWVPGITESLPAAEAAGADISVPLADYLAKTEPDVHKALHDHISIRDGVPTLDEMKIASEPKTAIADPVASLRASAGLEPLAMAGDRKIELKLKPQPEDPDTPEWAKGTKFNLFHDIDMHDETGKLIGKINLSEVKDGKQLYIEMINAGPQHRGFYQPNFLGPALIRDIKSQLKVMFPNAETISGHRVTGARDAAGEQVIMDPKKSIPTVKLQLGEDPQTFRDLLGAYWQNVSPEENINVLRKDFTPAESAVRDAVTAELGRIVPSAEVDVAHGIDFPRAGGAVRGMFQPRTAKIFVSLESTGPISTARHEAIHYLAREGFFTDAEWDTLAKAATEQGWLKKFDIEDRYSNFSKDVQHEEAIAEAYQSWRRGEEVLKDDTIFQKIKDFMEGVRRRINEALGKEMSWEDIFKEIDTGRVGKRELEPEEGEAPALAMADRIEQFRRAANDNNKKIAAEAKKPLSDRGPNQYLNELIRLGKEQDKLLDKPELTEFDAARAKKIQADLWALFDKGPDGFDPLAQARLDGGHEPLAQTKEGEPFGLYDRGKTLGITQSHMDLSEKLIRQLNKEDFEASSRRAELRQRRRSNKDWKDRRTVLRDEVREQLTGRPDIATDQFMTKYGVKFHPDYLSEEQKARLPKDYIQKKDGVNPDELAPHFGYTSGDAMVERLGMMTEDRRRSGMSSQDYLNRLIDVETDRRLNQEFGDREAHILEEAKDQALSETQLNLVHQDTLAFALKAGIDTTPLTRENVKAIAREKISNVPVGQLSSSRLFQNALQLGKKVEEAGAQGKWDKAYRLMQHRQYAVEGAKLALEYERSRKALDRTAKTFRKREVASVATTFTNWVHDLLNRVGYPLDRTKQGLTDLQENIGRQTSATLAAFVREKTAEWNGQRDLPIADFIQDAGFRQKLDTLSLSQFQDFKSAVDMLVKAGRDEKKIYVEGEARDLVATKQEMRDKLSTFGMAPSKADPGPFAWFPRLVVYGLTAKETMFNRWDRNDPWGIFNRTFSYPFARAANHESAMLREASKLIGKIDRPKDVGKLVDAPFNDPLTFDPNSPGSGGWTGFTKGHVYQMINNAGNESNLRVLAGGFGIEPEAAMKWLGLNSTKANWDMAQQLGDIFTKYVKLSGNMYERIVGAPFEKIELKPFTVTFADGTTATYRGWYHPLKRDPIRNFWTQDDAGLWHEKDVGKREDVYNSTDFYHSATANGYTKSRTGAIYPLDLRFDMTPNSLRQMIHDIAFREVVLESQKIFADRRFQSDVAKYYGREYADGLMPYLKRIAGSAGSASRNEARANSFLEKFRSNIISTYIAGNVGTIAKHGPTAWVWSMKEAGIVPFMRARFGGVDVKQYANAVHTLYGQSLQVALQDHDFVMSNFEEIQRRERHWQDTFGAQQNEFEQTSNLRAKMMQWGAAGVAWSDMVSAKPTALAIYDTARSEGLSHGDAVTLGERGVRRAHGSTAITNQPPLVLGGGQLNRFLTSVYGFFGTAMQRRLELAYQANDMWKLGREKELAKAAGNLPSFIANFMTYVVWPTIVEEAVRSYTTQRNESWPAYLASAATGGVANSILYARDLIHGLVTAHDPGVGLLSSAAHDAAKLYRDVTNPSRSMTREHAGKTVQDTITVLGEATGMLPKEIGNMARFGLDIYNRQQHPRNLNEVIRGITHGEAQRRVER